MALAQIDIVVQWMLWDSPIGTFAAVSGEGRLLELIFAADAAAAKNRLTRGYSVLCEDSGLGVSALAISQVQDYFSARLQRFKLPLGWSKTTPFARHILQALQQVPWGGKVSYGDLASAAGRPGAARAVGRVMATNPFPLIIPCHRVVGGGGQMVGYSGGRGIDSKQWLLAFEQQYPAKSD